MTYTPWDPCEHGVQKGGGKCVPCLQAEIAELKRDAEFTGLVMQAFSLEDKYRDWARMAHIYPGADSEEAWRLASLASDAKLREDGDK